MLTKHRLSYEDVGSVGNVVPVTVAGQHLHLLPLNGGVGGEPKCTSIPAATGAQPITELYHFWGSTNEKAIEFC